ncbi:unnamed protein product [Effrenium voratum]|nr:unnamed protein product [Effrenium voratum]
MRSLTDEQKQQISLMSLPKEMPRDERKRQSAVVGRALRSEGNPALLAKWTLSNDLERFKVMQSFVVNQSLADIHVEEKYEKWVEEQRSDKYVTVTLFQLEAMYGTSEEAIQFVSELVKGVPVIILYVLGHTQNRIHSISNCQNILYCFWSLYCCLRVGWSLRATNMTCHLVVLSF